MRPRASVVVDCLLRSSYVKRPLKYEEDDVEVVGYGNSDCCSWSPMPEPLLTVIPALVTEKNTVAGVNVPDNQPNSGATYNSDFDDHVDNVGDLLKCKITRPQRCPCNSHVALFFRRDSP